MRIKYRERITDKKELSDLMELLTMCDNEFVPPLSARNSTIQNTFASSEKDVVPTQYYENVCSQSAFVALENGHLVAFMSIKENFVCEEILLSTHPNIYITTVIVHPSYRNKGITNSFYRALFRKFIGRKIFTRTWSTNHSHLRILSSLKFYEHYRKINDRGPGIDTIYFYHAPTIPGKWQTIRQYRLTGNLMFLLMLTVLSITFVLTWAFTGSGMMHELSIAFATSLIASALCLLSDSILKYKDSQSDEYISNLKSFGIENLQFHKDELLESIMPKCRKEIWITGYRLIMTAKISFCDALREACKRTHGLKVLVLLVPPWCETFQLVYGKEDVTDNYIKVFSMLCDCIEKYNTNVEIRFTDKPIFNDTYKVDDRIITSPYLHCVNDSDGKITAKDFFSIDINDPRKALYDLTKDDYMAVWSKSNAKLDTRLFDKNFRKSDYHMLSPKRKRKLLISCCIPLIENPSS